MGVSTVIGLLKSATTNPKKETNVKNEGAKLTFIFKKGVIFPQNTPF